MSREDIRKAIVHELRAGHLAKIAGAEDLGLAAPLVELHLSYRLAPLKPWQKKVGVTPLAEADLAREIKAEFQRLFDQLKEMPLEANG